MSRHPEQTDCGEVRAGLDAFVDGDLGVEETVRFERHLEGCPSCREELEMARAVKRELAALPQLDAPHRVVQEVLATARREGRRQGARWSFPRPAPVLALAAAVALAIALSLIWRQGEIWRGAAPEIVETTSPADPEVQRAADEARLAFAYMSRATRRAGLEIRDGVIVERFVRPTVERFRTSRAGVALEKGGAGNES